MPLRSDRSDKPCPIAAGHTRFEGLRTELGASGNVLAAGLARMTQAGLVVLMPYGGTVRPRGEYCLRDARHSPPSCDLLVRRGTFKPRRQSVKRWTDFSVTAETKRLWRITFDGPPVNLVSPESANPDCFLNHYDTFRVAVAPKELGATGYPLLIDATTRRARLPVVSLATLLGRAYGGCRAGQLRSAPWGNRIRPAGTSGSWLSNPGCCDIGGWHGGMAS